MDKELRKKVFGMVPSSLGGVQVTISITDLGGS